MVVFVIDKNQYTGISSQQIKDLTTGKKKSGSFLSFRLLKWVSEVVAKRGENISFETLRCTIVRCEVRFLF